MSRGSFALILLGVLCGSLLYAQNYEVRWSAADFGRAMMTSPNYSVAPSVARSAPGQMAGSAYQAFIGFWQIEAACLGTQEEQQLDSEPLAFALSVAPNPMRLGAAISYAVPVATNLSLKLYDITGSLARTIGSGWAKPGRYTADLSAKGLARGVYILKLESGTTSLTRKVVLQ